ncbi:MAG: hypothetical protein QXH27_01855 [Candidatus Micrarchaeia archaeon]
MRKALLAIGALFLALSSSSPALSGVGEPCNYTLDCSLGYCSNETGTCINPAVTRYAVGSPCSVTADCREGYCTAGNCIVPITEAANFLAFGPKSGCAGLADAAALGNLVVVCDAMWILLVLFSGLAGFAARKEENRLVPVAAALLPLLIGALVFVFVGVIVAIVETALIFYKGERKAEYAELPKELVPPPA